MPPDRVIFIQVFLYVRQVVVKGELIELVHRWVVVVGYTKVSGSLVVITELLVLNWRLEHHLILVAVTAVAVLEILRDGLLRTQLDLSRLGYIIDASGTHRGLLGLQAHLFIIDF